MFCKYCGTKSEENAKFCGACGKPAAVINAQRSGSPVTIDEAAQQPALQVHPGKRSRRSLVIGIAVALILGLAIGAASFYLLRVDPRRHNSISTVSTAAATVLPNSGQRLPSTPSEVIDVTIDFDGTLLWNNSPVDRATLQGYISQEASEIPRPEVRITIDKFAKYEIVAQTVADLQHRGLRVILEQVQLDWPNATNIPAQINPGDITIEIDDGGYVYWNAEPLTDQDDLLMHLRGIARRNPQPEVHIRGDANVRYQFVGQVLAATKMIGIRKVTASLNMTTLVQKVMKKQVR